MAVLSRLPVTTSSEGTTNDGVVVMFDAAPDNVEAVKEMLAGVERLRLPTSHRVGVSHGGFTGYSRFDITRHDYAANQEGFVAVLEIHEPPDNRHGIVLYEYNSHPHPDSRLMVAFTEFKTVEDAKAALSKICSLGGSEERLPKLRGFIRRVVCGSLTPWFYAVGNEELIGDYTLPARVQDDPFFRLGQRFVVEDGQGGSQVKTCLGTRFFEHSPRSEYGGRDETQFFRLVYWDDGTLWDERRKIPVPQHFVSSE